MAKTYVSISNEEMIDFLKEWNFQHRSTPYHIEIRRPSSELELWILLNTGEDRIVVYTSLFLGKSRPVGTDAIRVRAHFNGRWHGKHSRINRVAGWQKRLADRLGGYLEEYEKLLEAGDKLAELTQMAQEDGGYGPESVPYTIKGVEYPTILRQKLDGAAVVVSSGPQHGRVLEAMSFCIYCGDPEINGEIPGMGNVCARHMDMVKDRGAVLGYFAVLDAPAEKPAAQDNWMPE